MRVKWLRQALSNLNLEAEYIAHDSPAAAERVVTTIVQATQHLRKYPALGRPGRVVGTRELVVHGTPYIVPHRIRGDAIELLRVLHGARKWPERL